MKPSDTITLNAPSEFPLQILHEVAIMTILITRGESLRARPLPPARCARCLPTAPPVFLSDINKNKQKPLFFSFKKQTRFLFSRSLVLIFARCPAPCALHPALRCASLPAPLLCARCRAPAVVRPLLCAPLLCASLLCAAQGYSSSSVATYWAV